MTATISPACEILDYLNTKAGRKFRPISVYLDPIKLRLAEVDNDIDGVKEMIDRQCALWKCDEKMWFYLRPATLFARSNFHPYYDDRDLPVANNSVPSVKAMPVWEMTKLLEVKQAEYEKITRRWDCEPVMPPEIKTKWLEMKKSIADLKAKIASTPV